MGFIEDIVLKVLIAKDVSRMIMMVSLCRGC